MRAKLTLSTTMLAACLSTSVVAQADVTGLYVLGGAGVGFLKDAEISNSGTVSDSSDLALRLGAGYQLNRYFGTEANYFYYAPVESEYRNVDYTASAQSAALLLVAKYPINKFAVFAKAGPSYTWKKVEASGFGSSSDATEEEWSAAYGAGVEYNFNNSWATQVEYLVTNEDAAAATANILFRF